MAFESDFLEFMNEVVSIERFRYMDSKKVKTYYPAVEYRARISGKIVSLRRSDKEEQSSIVDIWLNAGGDVITINDRITLPDTGMWIDRTPVIFAIGRYTDDEGPHNVKLQCGWMYHRQGQ